MVEIVQERRNACIGEMNLLGKELGAVGVV
jgi:hypothetical protein